MTVAVRPALMDDGKPVTMRNALAGWVTVATWTALPLLTPSTVTLACSVVPAVRLLRPLRFTVKLVRVALVTVPVTPLSKATLSLAGVGSKP